MSSAIEWRPVRGYEGLYEVSNDGWVRNRHGRHLTAHLINSGYYRVMLYENNHPSGQLVHRLVAAAFIGPCPEGYEVGHMDGVKTNNHADNLQYQTRSENIHHAWDTGLFIRKWTRDAIVSVWRDDRPYEEIGRDYDCTGNTISRIKNMHPDYVGSVFTPHELRVLRDFVKKPQRGYSVLPNGLFWARTRYKGKYYNIGVFKTAEKARKAYFDFRNKLKDSEMQEAASQ